MRDPVRRAVPQLVAPSLSARQAALERAGDRQAHDAYLAAWPCMAAIEAVQPEIAARPERLKIAAWNMERCCHVEASAELIRDSGAEIVLATEMDVGMARSGQRDTVRDLARLLGMGWVFGVEFVELRLGNPSERRRCAGQVNASGLHGNAILSRVPLRDAALIPLDKGGDWYAGSPKGDGQRRVGGRMAVSARVETGFGPVAVASVHFESESDPAGRAVQAARLAGQMQRIYGDGPCVIGGDLNTHAFHDAGVDAATMLADPEETEPAFRIFADAGFEWRDANTGLPTTRLHPHDPPTRPVTAIDWLLTRGVATRDPAIVPALGADLTTLSDHEMIVATVGAEGRME